MPRLHIAFVAPRFPDGSVIGGGETLLRNLAEHVARSGCTVDFLTTCARDHFTWKNEVPPGCRSFGHVQVRFFPVDEHRDITTFLRIQEKICRGGNVSPAEEQAWLRNSVNSAALLGYLREHGDEYDRIITGPYLFGLTFFAAQIRPEKTILVPCLHDEPFARLHCFTDLFLSVRGVIFNSLPERELAVRLYGRHFVDSPIVGMGLDPFRADARRFATKYGIDAPYILYCGRREPMKGTPLLVDYIGAFRKRTGRDVRLVLTGVGALELPPSANLYVTDLGILAEEEKHSAMAGAVAFCHASVNESLGIVLLESWLAETPALVHAASAVLRFQCERSQGGLWFRIYPEFEEELLLLLDNETLRRALGRAGREYVLREYSWQVVEKRLFAALES